MIRNIFLALGLTACICANAQEDEAPVARPSDITPFTGTDYVRVVFDKSKLLPGAQLKMTIRAASNKSILWQGTVVAAKAINEGGNKLAFTVRNLKPHLWTPSDPFLYEISLQQLQKGVAKSEMKERAGFRSFERRGGNLYLNGKPIFLRGIAINPPGRGIPTAVERNPQFAIDYVKYMKSINVNIIRLPDAEEWYDACDSLGMMVFGGNYSGKVAGGEKVADQTKVGDETDGGFPKDYTNAIDWYENEKFGSIAHHPSLMVYALTNETPFAGDRAAQWERFLDYAYKQLKQWDETRVYIANAGYGYGKTGDITDLHRYWGWYYSSPFTFLHIRDERELSAFAGKHQPLTFTECVGNYTGPDGRYNLTPSHKNPSSQLAWTGHAAQNVQAQLTDQHQSFTFRQATETFRQMRNLNPDLSGVFPFTILFYNWNTVEKFMDMNPKPVTDQVKLSYQPVLLSWECWTPNVFAGAPLNAIAHYINDADDFKDLSNVKLIYELKDKATQVVYADSLTIGGMPYYKAGKKSLSFTPPANLTTGTYQLWGKLVADGKTVSQNFTELFIANRNYLDASKLAIGAVRLYDPSGNTGKALRALNIPFEEQSDLNNIPANASLIIGENAGMMSAGLKSFVQNGGRLLLLRQDSIHLQALNSLFMHPMVNNNVDIDNPDYPVTAKSPRNGYYINPERPDHPIFAGIGRAQMRVWSDYTNWQEGKPGLPAIKPVTDGFTLSERDDVKSTAILGNYSSGLQAIALAEQFQGKGSIIISGLDLVNRINIDPVASRMLQNLVQYTVMDNGHELYQTINAPIVWGEYDTEKGIVTDLYSGFLVNATPRVPSNYLGKGIVVAPEGYQFAGGMKQGFNTRPGIQYVANGRRPFGPFAQSFGGQPVPDKASNIGFGKFWCRIPQGSNTVTTLAWNPSKTPLELVIKVNELTEVKTTIPAGEKVFIDAPADSQDLGVTYTADRRIVILQTSFHQK